MTQPPRFAERILGSLGAHTEFRDAVLGDLAEELALRAEWDGVRAARRWYYHEAVRTAPYLLRNWAHGLRLRDVTRLAGVVLTSYVFMLMMALGVLAVARSVIGAAGVSSLLQWLAQREGIPLAVNFAIGSSAAIGAGYIAGWLHARAPVAAALALGVVWSLVGVAVIVTVGTTPWWYPLILPVVLIVATMTGGALRPGAPTLR